MHDRLKRFRQSRTRGLQFLPMQNGKFLQKLFTVRGQFHQNFAPVFGAVPPRQRSPLDQPVDQLDCTVMAQAKPRRKRCDSGTDVFR